jgi:hypothetical protein
VVKLGFQIFLDLMKIISPYQMVAPIYKPLVDPDSYFHVFVPVESAILAEKSSKFTQVVGRKKTAESAGWSTSIEEVPTVPAAWAVAGEAGKNWYTRPGKHTKSY